MPNAPVVFVTELNVTAIDHDFMRRILQPVRPRARGFSE